MARVRFEFTADLPTDEHADGVRALLRTGVPAMVTQAGGTLVDQAEAIRVKTDEEPGKSEPAPEPTPGPNQEPSPPDKSNAHKAHKPRRKAKK